MKRRHTRRLYVNWILTEYIYLRFVHYIKYLTSIILFTTDVFCLKDRREFAWDSRWLRIVLKIYIRPGYNWGGGDTLPKTAWKYIVCTKRCRTMQELVVEKKRHTNPLRIKYLQALKVNAARSNPLKRKSWKQSLFKTNILGYRKEVCLGCKCIYPSQSTRIIGAKGWIHEGALFPLTEEIPGSEEKRNKRLPRAWIAHLVFLAFIFRLICCKQLSRWLSYKISSFLYLVI